MVTETAEAFTHAIQMAEIKRFISQRTIATTAEVAHMLRRWPPYTAALLRRLERDGFLRCTPYSLETTVWWVDQ